MLRSFPLIFSLSVFWRSLFSPYFDSFFHVLSWSGKKATLDGIRIFSSLDGKSLTSTFSSVFGENSPKILRILHFICSSSVIMWVRILVFTVLYVCTEPFWYYLMGLYSTVEEKMEKEMATVNDLCGTYRKRKFNFFNGSFIPHRIVSGCSNKHLSDGILDMWLSVPSRNQLKIGWYFGKIHHCNAFYKGELGSY
ncbi:uncharacterized protein LOC143856445 isoform X2 [Tasmannia lanceolata]|uniref:uncharacterized protein LOC143856445 isoform X2 n=1 Tax=Tasmannia lanceolata TaxID=3420 RepID=UPI0040628072